ncbi:MAG: CtsR family transcriptional regulator [Clostridium sp.]|nr:CtsR family transcriptional regulator [Clostridium sp.]
MARISDTIADFIFSLINETDDNQVIIQRNELADKFKCAPSQINYVLTTRFTYEKGYVIESRRGGGGYIIVKRIYHDNSKQKISILNEAIGLSITYQGAKSIADHLLELNIITMRECEIIKVAVNDRTLSSVEDKNKVRADILKGMVNILLS